MGYDSFGKSFVSNKTIQENLKTPITEFAENSVIPVLVRVDDKAVGKLKNEIKISPQPSLWNFLPPSLKNSPRGAIGFILSACSLNFILPIGSESSSLFFSSFSKA